MGASKIERAGYPAVLEGCATALAAAQIAMSWLALERLPSTVVPFGPTGMLFSLPGAAYEAEIWTWTVVAIWAVTAGASFFLYRIGGSTPVPVFAVALFALLAVMRAGAIGMNLDPDMRPATVVIRAVVTGIITLLLAAMLEQVRTRPKLRPALTRDASYDESAPRGVYASLLAVLLLPLLIMPTRVRVIDDGLVVITRISHYFLPRPAITSARPVGRLHALLSGGLNLATQPTTAVEIRVRGNILPMVISVPDRARFLESLDAPA